jgi:HEAT repeat protein
MTAHQAALAIRSGLRPRLVQLRAELGEDAHAAERLLTELARYEDPTVRDWAGWAAVRHLPAASAVALLELLIEDADADVRMEALRSLVDLDPAWARRLVPRYLAALRGRETPETVDAIWRLTQFREGSALPPLRELAERAKQPVVRNNARIAVLVLEGREEELISGLQGHDHPRCSLWIKGLGHLGSPRAVGALEDFARDGPDESCRERAAAVLQKMHQLAPISLH